MSTEMFWNEFKKSLKGSKVTIWIVWDDWYEPEYANIKRIFTTEEKAKEYIRKHRRGVEDMMAEEWEVDE